MVKRNPCRYCVAAFDDKGKHIPHFTTECQFCKNRKSYEEYLETKRMYRKGDCIRTEKELNKCQYVFWREKLMHIEVVRSFQYRIVLNSLRNGYFRKAVKNADT